MEYELKYFKFVYNSLKWLQIKLMVDFKFYI